MRLLRPTLCLLAALPFSLSAQAPEPGSAAATPAPAPAPGVNAGATGSPLESKTALEGQKRLFDTDSDAVNFEDGTMVYKGKTMSVGGSRFMRARFDRYLNTSVDSKALDQYKAIVTEIQRRLKANELQTRENFEEAFGLLFEAAKFEEDGQASVVVANLVFNALRGRDEFSDGKFAEAELARRRKYEQDVVANRTSIAKINEIKEREDAARQNRGGKGAPVSTKSNVTTPDEAAFRAADLAETQALLAATRVRQAANAIQSKIQFQAGIVNLLVQRRWEHANIACGFYRQIFKASSQKLETGKDLLNQFLPATETMDTIDSLEALAREAVSDVAKGMDAVRNTYDRGQLVASLERLQETFFLGEHLIPVISFEVDRKLKIRDVYTRGREVQQLLDLKDYDEVEKLSNDIHGISADFPARQILSGCAAAKRGSNMELFAAQTAFAQKKTDEVKAALTRATTLWPLNPAITTFTSNILGMVDDTQRATLLFDELSKNGSKRQMFDRAAELGVALRHDAERAEKLKKVMTEMQSLEFLLGQSQAAADQKNYFAAWEYLVEATKFDNSDVKLNKAIGDLAPQVAGYVQLLKKAENSEKDGDYASALASYLAAQDINPVSKVCNEGIKRTSQSLLDKLGSKKSSKAAESKTAAPEASPAKP